MSEQNQQQSVNSLTLNEAQIKQLEAIIQELPTKHGVPLLSFLNTVAQANFNEAQKTDALKTSVEQVASTKKGK